MRIRAYILILVVLTLILIGIVIYIGLKSHYEVFWEGHLAENFYGKLDREWLEEYCEKMINGNEVCFESPDLSNSKYCAIKPTYNCTGYLVKEKW